VLQQDALMFRLFVTMLLVLAGLNGCAPQYIASESTRMTPSIENGTFFTADGQPLPLRQWQPKTAPQAVLIALHGFNDYSRFIDSAASWWSQRGIVVYAYDQRGFGASWHHGRWPADSALAGDAAAFVELIHQRHPQLPVYLLGESMGAAVALQAMAETELKVDGVILSAPAVWGWKSMPLWQQWGLRLSAYTLPWQRFTGESLGVVASDNRAMLIALGRDPLVIKKTRVDSIYGLVNLMQAASDAVPHIKGPVLVLYGEKDQVIPVDAVLTAFAGWEKGIGTRQLIRYNNGYHMLLRDLQAERVWQDVLSWMTTRLPGRMIGAAR